MLNDTDEMIPRYDQDVIKDFYAKCAKQTTQRLRRRTTVIWRIEEGKRPAAVPGPEPVTTSLAKEEILARLDESDNRMIGT
jgi:hypothetical protein